MGTCGKLTPQRDFADSLILMGFGGLTNSIKRRFFEEFRRSLFRSSCHDIKREIKINF